MTSPAAPGIEQNKIALAVGASGIAGSAIVEQLDQNGGWTVLGLSRNPVPGSPARHISADLLSADSLALALADEKPTHVFFAGRRAVGGSRTAGVPLVRAPFTYGDRPRRGQRDEHGPDVGGTVDLVQRARQALRLSRLRDQWNSLTDMTDGELLAEHMIWAATTEKARNQAYNVVNGDVFRWRWMWPKLAAYFGVKAEGFEGSPRPLEEQMRGMDHVWSNIAATHGLAVADLERVASWWHTDADLGRNIEVLADMSKSRLAGFTGYRRTEDSFRRLFDRYRAEKIIP